MPSKQQEKRQSSLGEIGQKTDMAVIQTKSTFFKSQKSMLQNFVPSFNKYLLSTMSQALFYILGSGTTTVSKADKNPCPRGAQVLIGKTDMPKFDSRKQFQGFRLILLSAYYKKRIFFHLFLFPIFIFQNFHFTSQKANFVSSDQQLGSGELRFFF